MTISKATNSPLFVVIGSTKGQGRSIIRELEVSSKPYRVRAITRNAAKPEAKELQELGCEVVEIDVSTVDAAKKAFEGADIAFVMTSTDFSQENFIEKEYALAKLRIDGAKAGGAKTIVLSNLPHVSKLSGGKHTVDIFDCKAEAVAYARTLEELRIIDVQPGSFFTNYFTTVLPRKMEDGSFIMVMGLHGDTKMPVVDIDADYGKYVVSAVEDPSVETVYAAPAYVTATQIVEGFAKATGKKVKFVSVSDDELAARVAQSRGERAAKSMVAMYKSFRDYGYYFGADLTASNKILPRPARTFDEMISANANAVASLFA
ncbi:NAD(P)-binding protein [Schizopora paradoxa]|uniref:NAD(P)-binding protein n=1 Tax=Schizopora paradoxa TaxID=27342 RepID=A0A0H2SI32_9AGAM|nr:NAD(P)-binding protein [Schizopora paradoxa]